MGRSTSSLLVVRLNRDELCLRSLLTWVGDVFPPEASRGFAEPEPARGAPPKPLSPFAYFFTPPAPPPPTTLPAAGRLPGGASPPPALPSFISSPPFDENDEICWKRKLSKHSISQIILTAGCWSLLAAASVADVVAASSFFSASSYAVKLLGRRVNHKNDNEGKSSVDCFCVCRTSRRRVKFARLPS